MKTIALSEDVINETPLAYMVFYYNGSQYDYNTFSELVDAKNFAFEQNEKRIEDTGNEEFKEEGWPIYTLWAANLNAKPE